MSQLGSLQITPQVIDEYLLRLARDGKSKETYTRKENI